MELLKQKILSVVTIDPGSLDLVIEAFTIRAIDPQKFLQKKNTICNKYYFLEKGLLRFCYYNNGKEETPWIIPEGTFFTEILSLKSKTPSPCSIEALEPSLVLSIGETALTELCDKVHAFERYMRLNWEQSIFNIAQWKLLQQYNNSKVQYEFLQKNQLLMKRVPQKYLASIIGITPFTLSRLRKNKK